jgi:hypothetical protein
MKRVLMTSRDEPPQDPGRARKRKSDAAFDLWLKRGLHKLYDQIADEPVPEAILKLIEDHRSGGQGE